MNKSIVIACSGRCGSHGLMPILSDLLGLNVIPTKEFDIDNFEGCICVTHDYYGLKSVDDKFNIVVMIRDPRDISISAAYYEEIQHNHNFESELKKNLDYGTHNPDFYKVYFSINLEHYLIKFEEMIKDPSEIIKGMLDHFKYEYDSVELEECISQNSFDFHHKRKPTHFRKGIIGDWKNHMTEEENKEYCKKHENLMSLGDYK